MKGNAVLQKTPLDHSPYAIQKLSTYCDCCYRVHQKRRKIVAKIAKNMLFQISPFALPPVGHCGEKFNIQLHLFRYRMASKVCTKVVLVCTNIPPSVHFFEPLAHVCQFMVSTTKELSGKFYIGAHLQSHGYKVLVILYL